jgi:hypothetical protein
VASTPQANLAAAASPLVCGKNATAAAWSLDLDQYRFRRRAKPCQRAGVRAAVGRFPAARRHARRNWSMIRKSV